MELIKKWFESIRISFNWDMERIWRMLKDKEIITINDLEKKIQEELEEENRIEIDFWTWELIGWTEQEIREMIQQKKSMLWFVEDYYNMKNLIFNIVDWKNFVVDMHELRDRNIINVSYRSHQEEKKIHRIIQINEYKKLSEFWVGTVKLDGMFWRVKEETIFQDILYEIENEILKLDFNYLQRIDFFLDFNWYIKEFLENTKIRWFKTWSIFSWWTYKNTKKTKWIEIKETSTIYRWSTSTKRIVARLYNKRKDTIDKWKSRFFSYISEETKRFEVEIEEQEIRDYKKQYYDEEKDIRNFTRFLYKNTVLKKTKNNLTWIEEKKFDISMLEEERIIFEKIKTAKKRKNEIKNQSSFKLKHYWGYTKTMIDELWIDEFEKYLWKISWKINKNK